MMLIGKLWCATNPLKIHSAYLIFWLLKSLSSFASRTSVLNWSMETAKRVEDTFFQMCRIAQMAPNMEATA